MNLFSNICLFGISNYYVYRHSIKLNFDSNEKINIIKLYLFLNLVFLILFNIIGGNLYPSYKLFVFSSSLLMIVTSLIAILSSFYQIKNEIKNISLIQIIIPTIKVAGLLIGIFFLNKNLNGYSIVSTVLILIFLIGVFFNKLVNIKLYYQLKKNTNVLYSFKIIKNLAPYAFLNIFFILYTQGNTLLLGIISTPENAAVFGIAYLILNTFYIFPTAIFQKVLSHKLIYKMYKDEENFKVIIKYIIELLIQVSIVFIIIFLIFSPQLILFVFGESYTKSISLLKYLLLIMPFRLITILLGNILNTDDYIYARIKLELILTALNILLNIILINFFGITGVVISVIITELLLSIIYLKIVLEKFNIKINLYLFSILIPTYLVILFGLNNYLLIVLQIIILSILTKFSIMRIKILKKIL